MTNGQETSVSDRKQLIELLQEVRERMDGETFTIAQADAVDDAITTLERDVAVSEEKEHWYKVARAREGVILKLESQMRGAEELVSILAADPNYFIDNPVALERRAAAIQWADSGEGT